MPLARPIVCALTSGRGELLPALDMARAAARAGATIIQIREHRIDDRALLEFVRRVLDVTAGTSARVVVNERTDVAMAAGADGVHLRDDSVPASRVRAIAPAGFLVGRSVHSVEAAREAERDGGCDYLVFGTVFRSQTKPPGHPVAGLEQLALVCRSVRLPVVAIGGVTVARVPELARAGAAGIAAIGLFREGGAAEAVVAGVRQAFDTRS